MNKKTIAGSVSVFVVFIMAEVGMSPAYSMPNSVATVERTAVSSNVGMDYHSYQAAVRKAKADRKAALAKARAAHRTALATEVQAVKTACADERQAMEEAREAYRLALKLGVNVEVAKVAFENSVIAYRNARAAAEEYHAPDITAANTAYQNAVAAANKAYKNALNAAKALRGR